MQAKKYTITVDNGPMGKNTFVSYFEKRLSNEEIENGIILNDHLDVYTDSVVSEYNGLVEVEDELGRDYKRWNFEFVSNDEHTALMNDMYADVCPGIGVPAGNPNNYMD